MTPRRVVAVVSVVVGPGVFGWIACGGSTTSGAADGAASGNDAAFDAESPGEIPTTCVPFAPLRLPDAASEAGRALAADVACTTSEDCEPHYCRGCAICGVFLVVGLSKTNTVECVSLPCAPPPQPVPPCVDSGFTTQDCQFVSSFQQIAIACVNQQCMTYAGDAGSE
ncbi:MAG: hypothetical protein ACLP1X_19905 [Polyangiaceae bacterium]